jgi:hypothetical protein
MTLIVDRELLAVNLRTYGEDELAARVPTIDDATLKRIWEVGGRCAYAPNVSLLAKASALAGVEVLEGAARPLNWKRRKLKGIWPGM